MQLPKTLPTVPEDDHVRRLLQACPDTFEGRRNRALIALLEDSALRISEALSLRIQDVNFATRKVMVPAGKAAKTGWGSSGSSDVESMAICAWTMSSSRKHFSKLLAWVGWTYAHSQKRHMFRSQVVLLFWCTGICVSP